MEALFDKQKQNCLSAVDLSRKGSVDEPVVDLVRFINAHKNYFTTSSCSGRIIVVDNDDDGAVKKKGCKWILTSHEIVDKLAVVVCLKDIEGNAVFKFEPFILHVQCRTLSDAQMLLGSGVASGFRNSGISVGNKGKFITAIRSTHSLEVPLSCNGKMLVSSDYIAYLVEIANKKLEENFDRINRFFVNLQDTLTEPTTPAALVRPRVKKSSKTKASKRVISESRETSRGEGKGSRDSNRTDTENDSDPSELNFDSCCLFENNADS